MREGKLAGLPFRCPRCAGERLSLGSSALRCAGCDAEYPRRGEQIRFDLDSGPLAEEKLDRVKSRLKRFPRTYRFLQWLIGPLYFDGTEHRFIRRHVRGRSGVRINLGSGTIDLDPALINIDAAPYPNVDLVADIANLPLQDESCDLVINISVLEHVPDPAPVLREIRRVLKPGGLIYTDVPFVVGYHASPGDYSRWTDEGVLRLHAGFETLRLVNNGGPTSALLWILQEWIAVVLSCGSRRLHTWIYLAVMLLTFPLKFLDVALKHLPTARNISSCFIYVGRKPAAG